MNDVIGPIIHIIKHANVLPIQCDVEMCLRIETRYVGYCDEEDINGGSYTITDCM